MDIITKLADAIYPTIYVGDELTASQRIRVAIASQLNEYIYKRTRRQFVEAIADQLEDHVSGSTLLMEMEMGGYSAEEQADRLLTYADKYGWSELDDE